MDRFEELLSEYLDGTLDAAGRDELASMIDADPARRETFVALVREHRLLANELGNPGEDAFARRVMTELNKNRSQFVRAVMADLKKPGPGGRRPSPPTPRRPFRPRGGQGPGWVLWASLAAGLFVIVAVVLALSGGEEPSKPDRKLVKEPVRPGKVEPEPKPKTAPEVVKETPPAPTPKPELPAPPKPEPKAPETPLVVTPTPTPKPETPPTPTPPAPKSAPPAPEKAPATVAEAATLESVEGDVVLGEAAAMPGPLTAGFILETRGEKSAAVLRYPDGTRVEIAGLSKVQDEPTRPGHALTMSGMVTAEVAKQPVDKPMLFLTAHAEVRVLGTRLRVETLGEATRLDVAEGKVRMTRLKDKSSVEVGTGHYAVATPTGTMVSRPARVLPGLAAFYGFKEGKGGVVHDTSRSGAALDLKVENESAVKWTSKGLVIGASTLVASSGPATKIAQACKASNEVTVEAWIRPGTLTPAGKDSRIVSFSSDPMNQNFLLGQDELKAPVRSYFMRLRTPATDQVGKPALVTPDNTVVPKLSHLVYTRSATGIATFYIDGIEVARTTGGGALSNWNEGYRLAVGNEITGDRPWVGEVHLVAVYSRALAPEEVKQNFKAGAE